MNFSFRNRLYAASLALLALALCGGCATQSNPNQRAPAAIVEMHFHSFEPKNVTIHAGDIVEWRNTTLLIYHTVTNDPAKAESSADVALLPGAEPFDSGNVNSGATYQHVFTVPGTYRYFCQPHESKGMVGEVIVLVANQAPSQSTAEPSTQTSAEPATHPGSTLPAPPATP